VSCVQAHVSEWSLSTLPSPIPELQHAPLPLKVLWAKERAPIPPFSVVLYLDSLLSLAKSWECVSNDYAIQASNEIQVWLWHNALSDALPSHGVRPSWRSHKVKLRNQDLVARSRLPTLERGRGSSWEPRD
jgi:hypothetical protein